jgi:hypothetical protein
MTSALAYYSEELITTIKSFIGRAHGVKVLSIELASSDSTVVEHSPHRPKAKAGILKGEVSLYH